MTFKIVSLWTIGFFGLAMVVLLLCSARKEYDTGEPIAGIVQLTILIAALCAVIALGVVYVDRRGMFFRSNVSLTR